GQIRIENLPFHQCLSLSVICFITFIISDLSSVSKDPVQYPSLSFQTGLSFVFSSTIIKSIPENPDCTEFSGIAFMDI
ncbi:MAG: hypothetical protein IJD60_11405, partial [Clostridia bacterium]|nr:hypothetical protein [Clostridia bacterium]